MSRVYYWYVNDRKFTSRQEALQHFYKLTSFITFPVVNVMMGESVTIDNVKIEYRPEAKNVVIQPRKPLLKIPKNQGLPPRWC